MSEKEKQKRSPRMGFLRSCLIFSLYPLLILAVFSIGLAYWAIGGYVKSSLDPHYIPTAEYLLDNPFVLGSEEFILEASATDIFISLRVNLIDTRISMDGTFSEGEVCFAIYSGFDQDFQNLRWAEIYINEQVVNRFHFDIPDGWTSSIPALAYFCMDGHLNSGLHIIEFRAKESLFAEPYYVRRWAIDIE